MGQIFCACVYDVELKTSCVCYADKFHANCYSLSGATMLTHYLLRQKPYRVMWCGDSVREPEELAEFSRKEDLLGISTCNEASDFSSKEDIEDIDENYLKKAQFIGENHELWNKMDTKKILAEAENYFNTKQAKAVKYTGYLINHTKKLAVDLVDYYSQSISCSSKNKTYAIDLIPVLTETSTSIIDALWDGLSSETTENLNGEWCGDLLEIVDVLPADYKIINCCFAEVLSRMRFCYRTFGVDEDSFLLKNENGDKFTATKLNVLFLKRGPLCHIKVEKTADKMYFIPVEIKE